MKKSFFKSMIVMLLSTFIATTLLIDFKTIFLSVEATAYIMYGAVFALLGIILINIDSVKTYISLMRSRENEKKKVPEKIYRFARAHHSRDLDNCNIDEIAKGDKVLHLFFSKFKEKYSKAELRTFLISQKNQLSIINKEIRDVNNCIYLITALSTISAFIYDSHMKGILALSMCLIILNLVGLRRAEKNLEYIETVISVCNDICEDILDFKNARYIMYKVKDLLLLDDEEIIIVTKEVEKVVEVTKEMDVVPEIEDRMSALINLGYSNKKKNSSLNKRRMSA